MKAKKFITVITIETLSRDSIWSVGTKAFKQIDDEKHTGCLEAEDGDKVSWEIKTEDVEF